MSTMNNKSTWTVQISTKANPVQIPESRSRLRSQMTSINQSIKTI